LFLVACDWVGVRAAWVESLLDRRGGRQAVIFSGAGRREPAFALYHGSIIDTVRARIGQDRLDMQSLPESVRATEVPLPSDWHLAHNLNEPPRAR
jgi:molybdopterin-guanine dinucleotide biosynthesis protein A